MINTGINFGQIGLAWELAAYTINAFLGEFDKTLMENVGGFILMWNRFSQAESYATDV